MNFLINLIVLAIVAVLAFWILGVIAAALVLPAVVILLVRILFAVVIITWLVRVILGGGPLINL